MLGNSTPVKSNQARYILLGMMLVFVIASFGLELSRTVSKCTATANYQGALISASCDPSQVCFNGSFDGTETAVETDDNGNSYTITGKVTCAWSTITSALNFAAVGVAIIFGIFFSRAGGLKKISFAFSFALGSLAAAVMIASVGFQARDIYRGFQITNFYKAYPDSDGVATYSRSIHLANICVSFAAFLLLVTSAIYAIIQHRRRLANTVTPTQTVVKAHY